MSILPGPKSTSKSHPVRNTHTYRIQKHSCQEHQCHADHAHLSRQEHQHVSHSLRRHVDICAAPFECTAGKTSQQVQIYGSTAYVPQAPFILGGTVRDNIMFGREYDEARYRVAVQAAQLEPDLAQLPAGDMTELGE